MQERPAAHTGTPLHFERRRFHVADGDQTHDERVEYATPRIVSLSVPFLRDEHLLHAAIVSQSTLSVDPCD
jgi:hypothetical protein